MRDIQTCPICGNNQLKSYLSCNDFTVSKELFSLKYCSECDFCITTPRPEESKLPEYYQSADYVSHTSQANNLINRVYLFARTFTLRQKLQLVNRYSPKGSILDIGCGTGNFLQVCQQNGWKVSGIEPSSEARNIAAGFITDIKASLTENHQTQLDAITMWHVLEHVPDLDSTVKLLREKIHDNGTVFIAVPNFKSGDSNKYKEYWAGYDVPRHLWHFSRKAMKALMEKNGLRITDIKPMKLDSYYVSLLSEKYRNENRFSYLNIPKAIASGLQSNLAAQKTTEYSSLIYIIKK